MYNDWNSCLHLQQSSMEPCHHVWSCDYDDHANASNDQREWSQPNNQAFCFRANDAWAESDLSQQFYTQYPLTDTSNPTSMESVLVRAPNKRHLEVITDISPPKRTCRQEGNFPKYAIDRNSFALSSPYNTFTVRNIDGVAKSLELDDLVDMVLQVTKNIEDSGLAEHVVHLSKRRQQNKAAAARYRDKQKERKQNLQKEQADLERSNAKLKEIISDLEREVAEYKRKIMQIASDLTH